MPRVSLHMSPIAPEIIGPVATVFLLTDVLGAIFRLWAAPSVLFVVGILMLLVMLATPSTWRFGA